MRGVDRRHRGGCKEEIFDLERSEDASRAGEEEESKEKGKEKAGRRTMASGYGDAVTDS